MKYHIFYLGKIFLEVRRYEMPVIGILILVFFKNRKPIDMFFIPYGIKNLDTFFQA